MAYKTNSAVYAIKKEDTFNGGPSGGTFDQSDVILATAESTLSPEVDSIERKSSTNSYIKTAGLAGKETATGSIGTELLPDGAGDLNGNVLLETLFGIRSLPALGEGCFIGFSDAGITPANAIYPADVADTGTDTLYNLSKPCGNEISLAINQSFGCDMSDSQILDVTGVIPNSGAFDFPVADIATVTYDLGGAGFTTDAGTMPFESLYLTTDPFVGKLATFTIDDVTYEAQDLSLTIENTVVDREAITSQGITEKITTAKAVTGSFSVTFADYSELDKMKANADAAVYLEMSSGNSTFAVYLPRVRYTSVAVQDSDGVLINQIEIEAYEDVNGNAILLGIKDTTPIVVDGVTVSPASPTDISAGGSETSQLTAAVTYSSGSGTQDVTWTDDGGGSIATVDAAGLVTAVSAGTVIITATSDEDGGFSDSVTITVTA